MVIDILTLFPEMFEGAFSHSILKRAQAKGVVTLRLHTYATGLLTNTKPLMIIHLAAAPGW